MSVIETLRPNGAGNETNIDTQYPNSTEHWDKVDEATADDNTTYVENKNGASGVFQRDLYALPASSGSGTIGSIKVYVRTLHNASNVKICIRTYSTVYEQQVQEFAVWTTNSYEWTTNPNTGLAWTWTEIDALEIGVSLSGTTADPDWARCTQVYVEVNTPAFIPKIFYF